MSPSCWISAWQSACSDGATYEPDAGGCDHGFPLFMSPEQALGETEPDARSDIYSSGRGYYLLCGRPPFQGDKAMRVIMAHVHEPPPPLSQFSSDIPADLERVVMRCLAKICGPLPERDEFGRSTPPVRGCRPMDPSAGGRVVATVGRTNRRVAGGRTGQSKCGVGEGVWVSGQLNRTFRLLPKCPAGRYNGDWP